MFCSQCGAAATGNFCSACGARLVVAATPASQPGSWHDEHRYAVLIGLDAVRDQIAQCAAGAQPGLGSEHFLELCDAAFSSLGGVSLQTVGNIAMTLGARLGVATGKTSTRECSAPIGRVIVAALCSLARHGQALEHVRQAEDGCVLEAALRPDMRSLKGRLVVAIRRTDRGAAVEAAVKIPGQLFDWGKSKQCLERLFEDLDSLR